MVLEPAEGNSGFSVENSFHKMPRIHSWEPTKQLFLCVRGGSPFGSFRFPIHDVEKRLVNQTSRRWELEDPSHISFMVHRCHTHTPFRGVVTA